VREALLERQLMVALAPHLVRPLPLVVPAFDGARPDRLVGRGAEPVRRDVVDRDRLRSRAGGATRARAPPRAARRRRAGRPLAGGESWSPERHRVISGEEVLELLPALAAREPTSGYLFYDCQTDDVRLVLTVLGEAERFGAVCANRVDVTGLLERDGPRRGVRALDARAASRSRCAPRTWSTRPACGPISCARGAPRRGRAAAHPPEPRHAHHARHEDLPLVGGAIVPPGGDARSSRCPGSGTRSSAPPTTTTRARSSTSSPPPRTSTTCWRRSTTSSAPRSGPAT
jgi:glycerol-3-phosphate dehydrogenase